MNVEKAILAMVVDNEELWDLLSKNMTENDFSHSENKSVFQTLKKMKETQTGWGWAVLKDSLNQGVPKSYMESLVDSLQGIYDPQKNLLEYIRVVKEKKAKSNIVKEINQLVKEPIFDIDGIEKIITDAKIKQMEKEDGSLGAASRRYLDWIIRMRTNLTTGFPTFDYLTDTLNYGELVCVMGRTTTGKTFYALNILGHIIKTVLNTGFIYFSLEMPKEALLERMLQIFHNKPRYDLKQAIIAGQDILSEFISRCKNLRIYDRPYDTEEIVTIVKRVDAKVIFIDFLGLLKSEGEGSLYEKTTGKIIKLKQVAKELNILVFILVQLSRQAGDGSTPVTLDMARESGAIEEISDFVYGIWAPSINPKADKKWQDNICVMLLKNKRGPTRSLTLHFDRTTGKIKEIEKEEKG